MSPAAAMASLRVVNMRVQTCLDEYKRCYSVIFFSRVGENTVNEDAA